MNLAELLKEFLIAECGFSDWQIDLYDRGPNFREVIVYLSSRRLSFIIVDYVTDCCLLSGGLGSDPNSVSIEKCLFHRIDLREPDSFQLVWDKMNEFLPKNRSKGEAPILDFKSDCK